MKIKKIMKLLTVLLMVTCLTACGASSGAPHSFADNKAISPVIDQDGADPFVTTYKDQYLYTKTTGGNIMIGMADSIQTLGAAELISVYEPGNKLTDLWAPEIWHLDDAWYIYFAATIPGETIHRMFVLRNEEENPMEGKWSIKLMDGMDDKFAIDGTIMELDGKRYFLWSGWEGYENVRQDIYLAEMENPWEVKKEKILLSLPELDWEKNGNPLINEGPEVIVRNNTVNLVYSASGSWTDDYCLGLLTLPVGSDPKEASNWKKHEQPILAKTKDVYGPGHNSFVTTIDGEEDLIIYHAARYKGAGWTRGVRFGYLDFSEDGTLQKMEPVSGTDSVKIPSGEQEVKRFGANKLKLSGEFEKCKDAYGSIKGFVYYDDCATLTIQAEEEGDFVLTAFVRVFEKEDGVVTTMLAECQGEEILANVFYGENLQPVYFPVHLAKGKNEIIMSSQMGGSEIELSYLELRK